MAANQTDPGPGSSVATGDDSLPPQVGVRPEDMPVNLGKRKTMVRTARKTGSRRVKNLTRLGGRR